MDIKIGDKVRHIDGHVYTAEEVDTTTREVRLDFAPEGRIGRWVMAELLEIVQDKPRPAFKVGDKVRVTFDPDEIRTVEKTRPDHGGMVKVGPPAILEGYGPLDWIGLDSVRGEPSPRTWEMPAEPGPEVTAVRDWAGDVWHRTDDKWCLVRDARHGGVSWLQMLRIGPLTDASAEVAK